MINLSVQAVEPLANIRYSVAESFGYVASRHFDLMIDKVRTIFNCNLINLIKSRNYWKKVIICV
jgi:hypothetical protein